MSHHFTNLYSNYHRIELETCVSCIKRLSKPLHQVQDPYANIECKQAMLLMGLTFFRVAVFLFAGFSRKAESGLADKRHGCKRCRTVQADAKHTESMPVS
ncbi:hypothetical protein TNCV_4441131 [Trichonephila clavipes]|nr:hypothetical protein TNCV_4441131 [Trichonephila clavipes]